MAEVWRLPVDNINKMVENLKKNKGKMKDSQIEIELTKIDKARKNTLTMIPAKIKREENLFLSFKKNAKLRARSFQKNIADQMKLLDKSVAIVDKTPKMKQSKIKPKKEKPKTRSISTQTEPIQPSDSDNLPFTYFQEVNALNRKIDDFNIKKSEFHTSGGTEGNVEIIVILDEIENEMKKLTKKLKPNLRKGRLYKDINNPSAKVSLDTFVNNSKDYKKRIAPLPPLQEPEYRPPMVDKPEFVEMSNPRQMREDDEEDITRPLTEEEQMRRRRARARGEDAPDTSVPGFSTYQGVSTTLSNTVLKNRHIYSGSGTQLFKMFRDYENFVADNPVDFISGTLHDSGYYLATNMEEELAVDRLYLDILDTLKNSQYATENDKIDIGRITKIISAKMASGIAMTNHQANLKRSEPDKLMLRTMIDEVLSKTPQQWSDNNYRSNILNIIYPQEQEQEQEQEKPQVKKQKKPIDRDFQVQDEEDEELTPKERTALEIDFQGRVTNPDRQVAIFKDVPDELEDFLDDEDQQQFFYDKRQERVRDQERTDYMESQQREIQQVQNLQLQLIDPRNGRPMIKKNVEAEKQLKFYASDEWKKIEQKQLQEEYDRYRKTIQTDYQFDLENPLAKLAALERLHRYTNAYALPLMMTPTQRHVDLSEKERSRYNPYHSETEKARYLLQQRRSKFNLDIYKKNPKYNDDNYNPCRMKRDYYKKQYVKQEDRKKVIPARLQSTLLPVDRPTKQPIDRRKYIDVEGMRQDKIVDYGDTFDGLPEDDDMERFKKNYNYLIKSYRKKSYL